MSTPERVDLTKVTRAMVWSSNLSVGLFMLFLLTFIVMIPLAVAIPNYGTRVPNLLDLAIIIGPASIALLLLYPAAYYLVCVWRLALITELVGLGFGFALTRPFSAALSAYYEYLYKANQLTPEAYWESVYPGFWGNPHIMTAINNAWMASLLLGVAVASPFIIGAWRFKRVRSFLSEHGITLAYQPWRRATFRSQMRALSWPRTLLAVALFWAGIISLQAIPISMLGVFGGDTIQRLAICLAIVIGAVVLLRLGHGQMLATRRQAMLGLGQILKADQRAPVLFLRSFADDHMQVRSRRKPMVWPLALRRMGAEDSFEEALTIAVTELGPVIAIGRPGEQISRVGAAREYLSDETWRNRVDELISQSSLIIVLIGNTRGLAWEATRLLSPNSRSKVLFVVPPEKNTMAQARWRVMRQQICDEGGDVSELPDTVEDVIAWSLGPSATRAYCAGSRTQDTYELTLLIAGHEIQHGRIPIRRLLEQL